MTEQNDSSAFVQRVSTNVRGEADIELSRCTLLVGKCGAGKNAVIDAAALGLRGEAWTKGLGKKPDTLMSLAPMQAAELYSNLVLSSGEVCNWSTKGSPKTTNVRVVSENGLEHPVGVFVFDDVEGLLLGDPKRLQKAILGATSADVALHKVNKDLAESLHPQLKRVLVEGGGLADWEKPEDAPHAFTPVHGAKSLDWIASRKRAVNKEIKVLDVGADEAVPLSEAEIGELEGLRALHRKLSIETGDPDQLNAQAGQADQRVTELQARMRELSPMGTVGIERLETQVATLEMIAKTQKFLVDRMAAVEFEHGADAAAIFTCPCCGTKERATEDLRQGHERVETVLNTTADNLRQQRAAREEWDRLKAESEGLAKEAQRLRKKAALAGSGPDEEDVAAMARFKSLDERHKRSTQEAANQALLPELRKEVEELEAVKEVIESKLGEIVDGAAAVVEKRLNRFLPKTIRARIKVSGRKKDAVSIEAALDGGPSRDFRALSGGQRATLNAAVASATIPSDAPPVRLLVVNDLMMDSTTMRTLMRATVKAAGQEGGFSQAIFCAVTWSGKAPDGWSMINITRAKGAEVAEFTQA